MSRDRSPEPRGYLSTFTVKYSPESKKRDRESDNDYDSEKQRTKYTSRSKQNFWDKKDEKEPSHGWGKDDDGGYKKSHSKDGEPVKKEKVNNKLSGALSKDLRMTKDGMKHRSRYILTIQELKFFIYRPPRLESRKHSGDSILSKMERHWISCISLQRTFTCLAKIDALPTSPQIMNHARGNMQLSNIEKCKLKTPKQEQPRRKSGESQPTLPPTDIRPYLMDLGSANGTFLNDVKIDSRRYVELREKDVIKFASSTREYVLLHDKSG